MSKHPPHDGQGPDEPHEHPPAPPPEHPSNDYAAPPPGSPYSSPTPGYGGDVPGHGPGHQPMGEGYAAPARSGFGGPPAGGPGGSGRRTGVIVAVIAAIVLVVVCVVLAVVLLGDDSGDESDSDSRDDAPTEAGPTPEQTGDDVTDAAAVARTYIDATNARDEAAAEELACEEIDVDFSTLPEGVDYEVAGEVTVTGENATVQARSTSGEPQITFIMPLAKVDGVWCIAG